MFDKKKFRVREKKMKLLIHRYQKQPKKRESPLQWYLSRYLFSFQEFNLVFIKLFPWQQFSYGNIPILFFSGNFVIILSLAICYHLFYLRFNFAWCLVLYLYACAVETLKFHDSVYLKSEQLPTDHKQLKNLESRVVL